jgi:hypothetical protein
MADLRRVGRSVRAKASTSALVLGMMMLDLHSQSLAESRSSHALRSGSQIRWVVSLGDPPTSRLRASAAVLTEVGYDELTYQMLNLWRVNRILRERIFRIDNS